MKKIILLFASFIIISCSCKKATLDNKKKQNELTTNVTSNCPDDGTCNAIVYKNKKIDLLMDNLGKPYYQMSESTDKYVVKYEYIRTPLESTQDSGYREEIVFELNNNDKEANYSDIELVNQHFLYGRFCFCRGQTGYYQITKGNVSLKNSKLKVDFSTTEVPQIIKSFSLNIK